MHMLQPLIMVMDRLRTVFRRVVPLVGVLGIVCLGGCISGQEPVSDMLLDMTPPVYTEEFIHHGSALAARLDPKKQSLRSWMDLAPALERSREYVRTRSQDEIAVAHGDVAVLWSEVTHTLDRLASLLPRLDAEPHLLGERFRWLRLTQGADFSGYYEPLIKASLRPGKGYDIPLYGPPDDLRSLDLGAFERKFIGQRIMYRVDQGRAVPYYTRADIEAGALKGRKAELAYVRNPLDAYFLHIQGSGRLLLPDGSEKPVLFAATNGRPYTGIGRLLYDRGSLSRPVTQPALRRWLEEHPKEAQDVLHRNERYVFFRFAEEGPVGGMGRLLSPWVSMAVDPNLLPLGAPVVFSVDLPFPQGDRAVHGLGFAQDTGAAIKGRRVDVFCGSGEEAEYVAGHLNEAGAAWLLLARD